VAELIDCRFCRCVVGSDADPVVGRLPALPPQPRLCDSRTSSCRTKRALLRTLPASSSSSGQHHCLSPDVSFCYLLIHPLQFLFGNCREERDNCYDAASVAHMDHPHNWCILLIFLYFKYEFNHCKLGIFKANFFWVHTLIGTLFQLILSN
jgi:hypothetical protein